MTLTTKQQLQQPFEEQDIDWRVQSSGENKGKPWAIVIPYITNRAIQKRLDDVFDIFGWENAYKPTPAGTGWVCGLTIHSEKRSVTKWDGAEETKIESLKGGLSNSMKRAAVQLGIGRYLYQLEPVFPVCVIVNSRRDCDERYPNFQTIKTNSGAKINFAWGPPPLPEWALPGVDFEEFIKPMQEATTLDGLRHTFEEAYKKAEATGIDNNSERAIEVKDEMKVAILKTLESEKESNENTLSEWLKTQTDAFNLVPNESACVAMHGTTKTTLIKRSRALGIDEKPLIKTLKKALNERVKELQKTGEK